MKKRVSLKDIANQAGVSTAIVSYVLNNKYKGRVSETKANDIKGIAAELNYFPNQIAKSLKNDKTFTIGLIIADISNLFYSNVARHIEDEAKKYNYNIIFGSADENPDKFKELVLVMLGRRVDGIILAAPKGTESILGYLMKQDVPFVLIDRFFPQLQDVNSVCINNYEASYLVVEHIALNGYKKPAMVTLRSELFHMWERTSGFRDGSRTLLNLNTAIVVEIQEEELSNEIEDKILSLLREGVDLVYFSTNKIAMEGLAVLVKHNVVVPNEVGVICFDEADAYKIFNTSITFVKQPLQEIGSKSVEMLISLIDGNRLLENAALETRIVPHNSSAPRKNS